ncbi:MAG: hypothetical protein M3383_03490 [Actinomycetota bacterium]|nr:hypothetical protein [Actinomycetota bacterium]
MSDRGPFNGRALIEALISAEVRFVVIGGLAVIAHGHARTTDDLDIVPDPDKKNLERLASVLNTLDYRLPGLDEFDPDELVKPDLEALVAGGNWVLSTRFGGLDILQFVKPDLDYVLLAAEAIEDRVFGLPVQFCSYRHLVEMKRAAGRPVDIGDLEALREIHGDDGDS